MGNANMWVGREERGGTTTMHEKDSGLSGDTCEEASVPFPVPTYSSLTHRKLFKDGNKFFKWPL